MSIIYFAYCFHRNTLAHIYWHQREYVFTLIEGAKESFSYLSHLST